MPHENRAFWSADDWRRHHMASAPLHVRASTPTPDLAKAMGVLMRLWRRDAGMTVAEVARRMGTHGPIVSRLESGLHTPGIESLNRHARATGADASQALMLLDAWHGLTPSRTD